MAQPDLTQPPLQSKSHHRLSLKAVLDRLSYREQALGYLIALLVAEAMTTIFEPRIGMILHGIIFVVLLLHASLAARGLYRKFLLALSLAPLIRLLSLSMPLTSFPYVYWYMVVGAPLFLAVYIVARVTQLGKRQLGLHIGKWHWQIVIGSSGLLLGLLEYLILRPDPLTQELSWGSLWLPALILIIFTGFLEELIFRGAMQYTAARVMGKLGLVYVATVFTVLHLGYHSLVDLIFVFVVAVYFAWAVQITGSLLGVTISHGLINVALFLIFPFIFASPSQQMPAPQDVLAPAPISASAVPILTRTATLLPSSTPTAPPTPSSIPTATLTPSSTPTATPTPFCNNPSEWIKVEVTPGDTLEILAQSYGTTVDALQNGNCLSGDGALRVGNSIFVPLRTPTVTYTETTTPTVRKSEPTKQLTHCRRLPSGWVIYIVKKGDTLRQISSATGTTVRKLRFANCLTSNKIHVGQSLYVPYLPPTHTVTR